MIHHENDVNPGPLTVSGFKGGGCSQANWPDNNRTLSESTAKGQRRLWVQPGYGYRFPIQMMPGNTSGGKLRTALHAFSGYPDLMKLFQANALSEFDDYLVLTEFRRLTSWLANYSEKNGTIAISTVICSYKPCEGVECINHSKTLMSSYIAGKYPSGYFTSKSLDSKKLYITPLERRKTNLLNRMVKLLKWQECHAEFDLKLCDKLVNN